MTVTVDGNGRPFWLVLGESQSAGWRATLAGGHGLGPSHLIDGYANGWYVPAGVNGPTIIHLTWTPQRVVWAAIGVSAVSLAVATMLAVWPGGGTARRRRARSGLSAAPAGSAPPAVSLAALAGAGGSRPRLSWLIAGAGLWALLAGAASRPIIGLMAGLAVAAGCLWGSGRLPVRVLSVLSLAAVGVYVLVEQHLHHYLPDINWPANLNRANDLAWLGLALLGADVVVGFLRSRGGRNTEPGEECPPLA